MNRIRANRESIDDRFSVLGFTVHSDSPLYEIGLATDPELFKPENKTRRTRSNFFTSSLLSNTNARGGDSVYLVPPTVVSRFVGQPKLYFGLATFSEKDRSRPITVRRPDQGAMYVNLSGLTERGLRRTARPARNVDAGDGYGAPRTVLSWGGDVTPAAANGAGDGASRVADPARTPSEPVPYSDGYPDELWQQAHAAGGTGSSDGTAPVPAPATPAPSATPEPPAVSQGLGFNRAGALNGGNWNHPNGRTGRAPSRTLLVSSYYQPTDWLDALRTQASFFLSSAMWFLGVPDTTIAPHSRICQIRGRDEDGTDSPSATGFFIAPRLILTAAHVVWGRDQLVIVPAKNGDGTSTTQEPYGRFNVSASDWVMHPSYTGDRNHDFDLALIHVPAANAAPAGRYFDVVEELTQSRPEGVVVCGYAAWWNADTPIEHFVNNNIDKNRQHAHGGYIRELTSDDTFSYDLQTLGGTSGSPVYWIEQGPTPRVHVVGVHVDEHDETTNLGCRITPAKLVWIRQNAGRWGEAVAFSLAARSLDAAAPEQATDDSERYSCGPEPVEDEFATEQALRRVRTLDAPGPDYPGASRFVPAHPHNYRVGRRAGAVVDRIVIHITAGGPSINGTISWFQNGDRPPSSAHYIVGRDGEVVQMVRNADTAYHASSANARSIGIEHNANKPYRLNRLDLPPTDAQYEASAALTAWLAAQYGIPLDREHIVGHAEATPSDNHDCPSSYWDWNRYMACVQAAASAAPATAQSLARCGADGSRSRALSAAGLNWPSELAEPRWLVRAFMEAWQARSDNNDAARREALRNVIPQFARALQSDSGRQEVGQAIVSMTTAVALNAFRLVENRLPRTFYAQISVDASQPPPAPSGDIRLPRDFPEAARPLGLFLAWIDAAIQQATSDTAERLAMQREAWDGANAMLGAASTLLGLMPGLGTAVTFIQLAAQGVMNTAMPDFDAQSRSFDAAMQTIRNAYKAFAGSVLQGLIQAKLGPAYTLDLPLDADVQAYIDGFSAHALLGWQNELNFLGVGSPATGLSVRAPASRAQEIIAPYYDPSDPATALSCQNDAFSQAREEWFVGVENTASFPHSAICQLNMTAPDGSRYSGTGAYIGRNRILTCAHNLHGMSSVQIVPGRNGAGSAPFGQCTVQASSWRVAPRYTGDGNWDNDLAVIDNVPLAAPNGRWFQFLQATPSDHMPLVVCGYSAASRAVPGLTDLIDGDKQHLHGGYAQAMTSQDTIDYPILSLMGASGSPVYTLRDTGHGLDAYICAVHVSGEPAAQGLNRGCFITPTKIDWIEGRATTFGVRGAASRALSEESSDYPVALIPQPDKNACWAASMAMLLSFRGNRSIDPETLAREVGGSLSTSYDWDLLERVSRRYGFVTLPEPSNASLYHAPTQWAQWLQQYGPLWVVIVGAPHAVVLAGIRGDLSSPSTVEVKVLNPWDTRVSFDNDPVAFNPPNRGQESWLPFEQFASDFGNMAEPDYGNWRVLHLPVAAAAAQSLGTRQAPRLSPAPIGRSLSTEGADATPIEPTRVRGTRMTTTDGRAGNCRWRLDRMEGRKTVGPVPEQPVAVSGQTVQVDLGAWPALEGEPAPLPLTVSFTSYSDGSIGDVSVQPGTPAQLGYGVDVVARIDDDGDVGSAAAVKLVIDVRFAGLAQGAPTARIALKLLGDGRYERFNQWLDAAQAA